MTYNKKSLTDNAGPIPSISTACTCPALNAFLYMDQLRDYQSATQSVTRRGTRKV